MTDTKNYEERSREFKELAAGLALQDSLKLRLRYHPLGQAEREFVEDCSSDLLIYSILIIRTGHGSVCVPLWR